VRFFREIMFFYLLLYFIHVTSFRSGICFAPLLVPLLCSAHSHLFRYISSFLFELRIDDTSRSPSRHSGPIPFTSGHDHSLSLLYPAFEASSDLSNLPYHHRSNRNACLGTRLASSSMDFQGLWICPLLNDAV
jgi:hypothetical protein